MWFGSAHTDPTPGRAMVLRDILTALLILGIASVVVWYAATRPASAAVPAPNDTGPNVARTAPQHPMTHNQQKEVVLYIAYPCAECQTLVPSLVTALAPQSGTAPSAQVVYRPVHRDTATSRDAAAALFCAREQDMFETYYAALPTAPDAPIAPVLRETATHAGLDYQAFVRCTVHTQTTQHIESYTEMMHLHRDATPPTVAVVSVFTDVIDPATIVQTNTP